MRSRWESIDHWLAEHAPEVVASLNPPATEAEVAKVEGTLGIRFPESVRRTYLIHNGESKQSDGLFGMWRLLSLEEVVSRSNELARLSEQYDRDDFEASLMIPILESSGDFYYVESSEAGEETAVVEWWHESPSRTIKARSFIEFMDRFIERLRTGGYVYLPGELKGLIDVDDL